MIKIKLSLLIGFVFAIQNISFSQTNIDFETGNLTGWTGDIGANMNSAVSFAACSTAVNPPLNGTNLSMLPLSYFSMMTPAAPVDPYGSFSLTSPLGGSNVIRLGTENTNVNEGGDCSTPKACGGAGPAYCSTICGTPVGSGYIESPAEAVVQTFAVTSANALLTYAWAGVLNDGGHAVGEEPYVEIKIYNQSGVELTCFTNRVIQKSGVTSPGWTKSPTVNCQYSGDPAGAVEKNVYYRGWTTVNVLLSSYIGQNVTVRFAVAGCVDGGHFGYAYFDAKTSAVNITTSNASPCGSQTVTLTAPAAAAPGPYSWSGPGIVSGASTGTVTVNAAGTYTLSVGTGTCVATMTAAVTYSGGPSVTASSGSPTICNGQSAVLTAGGATTYTWSANAGSVTTNTASVNPTTTTIYTVTGSSAGCTGTQTVAVNVTPTPTISFSGTTSICSGQSTILTATPSAGTFTWSANAGSVSTNTVSVSPGLGTTIYTVTGNNSGCPGTNTVSVTVSATPTVNITGTLNTCSSNAVVLTGATATNYTWSPGGITTSTISVNPSSNTTYTLTGASGTCTSTAVATVTVTPTPTVTVNSPSICSGQSATLTAATATNYSWSTTATTNTISVSPTSTTVYTVTGDNGNGCTTTKTATVTVVATPTVNISGTLNTCSSNSVVLTGATATNYTWSPGGVTTNTISVNPNSTTTYTLTGANGVCTTTVVATVTVTPTPTITVNSPTICSGQSATLTAATANTYTWSTAATTNTISVNPNSTTVYTVTGDDGNGCTTTKTATVTVNPTPTVTISGAMHICSGQTLILTGATATNYTWSPGGQTTSTISITPPTGSNTYTLTGANGTCTATTNAVVDVSPTPTVTLAGATICSGQNTVLTAGGAGTYTWSANAGSVNTSTVSVNPGTTTTYSVAGTTGTCTNVAITTVTVNPTPTLSLPSSTYTICSGNGTSISASGANTYTWTTGTALTCTVCANPTATPTTTTTYTVTGTTGSCVSAAATVTVTVNPLPTLTVVPSSSAICSSTSSTLTASGANSFTWSPAGSLSGTNGSTVTATPVITTTYNVVGTDANGCINNTNVTINVSPTPTITINSVPAATCSGQSVVLTGGTSATYTWSTNAGSANTNTVSVTPGTTTTYTLIGTTGTCTASAVATVTVNPLPVIGTASTTPAPCGQSTGCINNVSVSGGTPNYQYSWNNGTTWSNNSQNCNIAAGSYTLEVQDANGCNATQIISVASLNGPVAPQVAATTTVACVGDTASLSIVSPQPGITYTWTDNTGTHTGTTYTISNIGPGGNYNITVTASDINNCLSGGTPITILVNDLPNTLVTGTTHFCKNSSTVLNASPSGAGYSYQWTQNNIPLTGQTTANYTATAGGNYGVIITDNTTGCKASSAGNYTVTVDSLPKIDTTGMIILASNCNQSTGSIDSVHITPSAGNTYSWTDASGNVVGTSVNLGNVPAGNYCLQVTTTATNCKDSICTLTVNNAGAPNSPAVATPNNTYCQGQTINPINVTGTGTFTWYSDGGLTNQIATGATYTPTVAVTTTVYVTATNSGCPSLATPIVITINPTPNAPLVATPSYTYCQNQNVATISASGTGTLVWSTSANMNPIVNTGNTYTPTGLPIGTTTYYLQDTSATGCKSVGTTTVSVTINQTPTDPTLTSQSYTYCQGQTISPITANGSGTILWYDNSGLTPVINTGATYTPPGTLGTSIYYIVDSSNAGCKSTGTVTVSVTINQTPNNPTTSAPSYTYCQGQTVNSITVNGTGNILWSTSATMNPVINIGTTYTPTGLPIGTTTYYLEDSTNAGCKSSGTSTVTVTIYSTPTVSDGSSDTAKCGNPTGGITGINVIGGTPGYNYLWTNASGATVGTTANLNNVGPGTYSVLVTDANGCVATGGATTFTVASTSAVVTLITPPLSQGQAPLNVTFTNATTGATAYVWNFGNGISSNQQIPPAVTYTAAGTYTVILFATNTSGCLSTDTAIVIVDNPVNIVVPNIYSPNGDGTNDEFFIICSGIRDLHCDIYNRWGTLVYQLLAPDQKWDGILNNGNPASEGTYFYILEATDYNGKTYKSDGTITLVK